MSQKPMQHVNLTRRQLVAFFATEDPVICEAMSARLSANGWTRDQMEALASEAQARREEYLAAMAGGAEIAQSIKDDFLAPALIDIELPTPQQEISHVVDAPQVSGLPELG